MRGTLWDRRETADDFMTWIGRDVEQKHRELGGGVSRLGRGSAQAVSSERLLEGSAGAQLGPQDALSPR